MRHALPDLLREERHEGVQQAKRALQDVREDILCRLLRPLARRIFIIEPRFCQLDVPVAELAPDKLVDHAPRFAQLELLQILRHARRRLLAARQDPAVGERIVLRRRSEARIEVLQIHEHEARGVPQLVREISRRFDALPVEAHVVARRVARNEHEAQGVRTVLVDDLDGIDAVAERLRHLAPLAVAHETVDEYVAERDVLAELQAHHDHACDPEEDDVIARHENARRVELLELGRLLGPAHRLERPESRAEPCVEHVLILVQMMAAALWASLDVLARDDRLLAVFAIPRGDAMPPPKLTRDAPVADIFEPVHIDLRKALGHELDAAVLHRLDRGRSQALHLHEPLLGDERLDRRMAARAVSDGVLMLLCGDENARLFEVFDEHLAALVAVESRVLAETFRHRAVIFYDAHLRQVMTKPHFEVVRIVRRRNLDRARTEGGIDVLVGKDGNRAVDDGQDDVPADEILVACIIGMHGDSRIAEHRLRARRRDLDIALAVLESIAQMPEMTRLRLVLDFDVRKRRIARRAPIRNARSLIDQPLLVKAHENFAHGARAALVHREALARPVARRAERSELIHDAAAVLLLPLPDALRELLAPEFVAVRTLCAKRRLHLRLRRDARMVAARHPKSIIALHAPPADQDVLQGIVERMPHVQLPRHIGRRNHDGKRLLSLLGFGMKEIVLLPELVPSLLKRLRLINLRDIILCHEKTSIHVVLTQKSPAGSTDCRKTNPRSPHKPPANKK